MIDQFFDRPILNSPYEYPARYWELDASGQLTSNIIDKRRPAKFITPLPKPKKRKGSKAQQEMVFDEGKGVSTAEQQYNTMAMVNEARRRVDLWRQVSNPSEWQVTPETAWPLQHWPHYKFTSFRSFFCQIEAVETAICLTQVVPKHGKDIRAIIDHLTTASEEANPGLARLALKLATGAGKTTVMAMIIAWQTINAVRSLGSKKLSRERQSGRTGEAAARQRAQGVLCTPKDFVVPYVGHSPTYLAIVELRGCEEGSI